MSKGKRIRKRRKNKRKRGLRKWRRWRKEGLRNSKICRNKWWTNSWISLDNKKPKRKLTRSEEKKRRLNFKLKEKKKSLEKASCSERTTLSVIGRVKTFMLVNPLIVQVIGTLWLGFHALTQAIRRISKYIDSRETDQHITALKTSDIMPGSMLSILWMIIIA